MPRQRNHQDTQRSVHWRTPNLLVNDPRTLPVRQVAYCAQHPTRRLKAGSLSNITMLPAG